MTWLLGGIVLGVLGTVFLPRLAAPYLPDALRGEHQEVAGTVNAKAAEVDRLLLTVGSDVGAMLVTYTKNVPEIDLLVDVGDSVVLVVGEYAPFVENAKIRRVTKQGKAATPDAGLRDPTPEPAAEPPADSSIVEGLTADGPESEAAVTDDTQ
ncbi:MAG: hypothetical protein OEM23_01310 [Gemmatimonadota bacterium]|nr:hypothetical protein [Gemmatimonadota bacterium]MDH3427048.1 hypothetical protein [Gemmatimonadota bacterium]